MLSESEENGQIIIAEAKLTAATELASEREHAQEELRDLETTRGDLESVVAEIQARLDNERDTLRSLAASFQSFVEKFEPVPEIEVSAGEQPADEQPADEQPADEQPADEQPADELAGEEDAVPESPQGEEGPAVEFLPAVEEEPAHEPGGALEDVPASDAVDTDSVPEVPVVEWDEEDAEVGHDPPDDREAHQKDHTSPDVVGVQVSSGGNGASHRETGRFPQWRRGRFSRTADHSLRSRQPGALRHGC